MKLILEYCKFEDFPSYVLEKDDDYIPFEDDNFKYIEIDKTIFNNKAPDFFLNELLVQRAQEGKHAFNIDGEVLPYFYDLVDEYYQTDKYKNKKIIELKKLLSDSDWKVIVNSELVQAELPLKYPDLHTERQAWRDEINQLEGELESLSSSLE
jgi:hypothetical protein